MKTKVYPFLFKPIYKNYIWGGNKIYTYFHRKPLVLPCAESWELSLREEEMSIIKNGHFKGKTLKEILQKYPAQIMGKNVFSPDEFPLLIKILDARENLSIQVHPAGDSTDKIIEAKSEMWYIIDTEKNAFIYAGFIRNTDINEFTTLLQNNRLLEIIRKIKVTKGDVFFIPAGRIHAIGAGCLILEIQQNSNITYRIFDWNRTDIDGNSRPLHIKEAIASIKWNDITDPFCSPKDIPTSTCNSKKLFISCPHFQVEKINIMETEQNIGTRDSFEVLFVETGKIKIIPHEQIETYTSSLGAGSLLLIPAAIQPYSIANDSPKATLLRILPGFTG